MVGQVDGVVQPVRGEKRKRREEGREKEQKRGGKREGRGEEGIEKREERGE